MRRVALIGFACLSCVAVGRAQSPVEFIGRIEKDLVPGRLSSGTSLTAATDEARKKLGALAADADLVFSGEVSVGDGKRALFLIASGPESRALVTDLNGNGAFESNEKIALVPALVLSLIHI